ncbi:MAG: aminotransferase class V-fold PLP-dependent enzyme [Lutibacter sp.]|uniref:trans-sulfuration enzyme family protein n=1 Tax=Lutibacter sp. TaxID=1925666 RepID=UPI00179F94E5|nr:aminotransferase class V-fold PLP-dependent enzyme [Lutibacter sp.]MBT8316214.1 PLP-dependent aspartate aminotransferase family protein [Lutibacter sp.]NNJ57074.1 aminotransferase class V-fold PLP-dependent enzyme [Lutibacter sp.]
MKTKPKFETLAIKSTENQMSNIESVSTPIYLSSTYKRNSDGTYNNDLIYSRNENPNRKIIEYSIAQLERGKHSFAFSSGMAAVSAIFQSLKTGDHIILPDDIYFTIKKLLREVFEQWNLTYDLVDMCDLKAVESTIKPNTSLIWVESPSNPQLKISDIKAISEIAHKKNIVCAVDNTWATPVLQNPLELGADMVIHSTTKYFGGHSDVLGGCVVLNDDKLAEKFKSIQVLSGAVPSPFDCWLIARGIQTLHLRVSKQAENALKLAQYLESHPKIKKVLYPGLVSHPQHLLAKKQFNNGFGAMLSILIKATEKETFNISTKLKYFATATSLGGVESLVEHRKSVEGMDSLTPENLIRISVGIENIDDLIQDWKLVLQ